MPVLMLSYLSNEVFGFVLNLLTVMSFTGLHEVARELESPFSNAPNDVPLNNFQAQFNEALLQMFRGFHPEAYWEVVVKEESEKEGAFPTPQEQIEENLLTELPKPLLVPLDESPAGEDGSGEARHEDSGHEEV